MKERKKKGKEKLNKRNAEGKKREELKKLSKSN